MTSSPDAQLRRIAIRDNLARRVGPAPDAVAMAAATVGAWREIRARLAPVIGARGVDVLMRRALYLTSADYPWLGVGPEQPQEETLDALFEARFAGRADDAAEGACALLAAFTELLTSLLGDSLTATLLDPVWRPSPASDKETTP